MHLCVPDWVVHRSDARAKRTTIYSVSVHPDGTRIATGGLDTKIRIWSTAPILDERVTEPRQLCTLARHTGAVLAVRFSHSGRYLVSGSDDTVALVWELDENATASTSFGSDEPALEHWRIHRRLVGHSSDVTDIAWSESDSFLATASLDSLVIVWSGDTFARVRTIRGHHGFVKGVAFDPTELFLASSSDDHTVKIWRTHDWGLEASISQPFRKSPSSTFFHRMSWTPDGKFLLTANAMNGPVFVSGIIERYTWKCDLALVGHENAISVAACSPRWFAGSGAPVCVVALGAQDQSVSVWMTGMARPLMVARNLFERSLMDVQWSADGYVLYACSSDGSVAALAFDASDLANTLPESELLAARKRNGAVLKERPAQVPLKRPAALLPPPVLKLSDGPPERLVQTITRDKNGKRRICPTPVGTSSQAPWIASGAATLPSIPVSPPKVAALPRLDPRAQTLGGDTSRAPLLSPHTLDVSLDDHEVEDASIVSTIKIEHGDGVLEVRNDAHLAEVVWIAGDKPLWLDYATSPVVCAAVADKGSAVALQDNSLVLYSRQGRRLVTLMMPTPIVQLAACGSFVAAAARDGVVRRWDLRNGAELGLPVSLPRDSIAAFYVHTNGVPVAVVQHRQSLLALDISRNAFICIGQACMARLSSAWDVRRRSSAAEPVRHAESVLNDVLAATDLQAERGVAPVRVLAATLRHLEMRMQAAIVLDSIDEYKAALHALGATLASEGIANQADDLLKSLLGPVYHANTPWEPNVLGMSKRSLLADLLSVMAGHKLDRLVHGYQDVLRAFHADP